MEEAIKVLTNNNFISAIIMVIGLIIIGFSFRKTGILNSESKKTINTLLMKIFIPCLAFVSFIMDFDTSTLIQSSWIILITIVCYLFCLFISRIIFIKFDRQKRVIFSLIMSFGQITLFGLPLVRSIYPASGNFVGNIMSLPFRFFVYFYSFIVVSGIKLERKTIKSSLKSVFLNPIIIAMLISVLIWITQPIMPKVEINGLKYSFLRIDKTIPFLYSAINVLSNITTPLCMLLIGITLGEATFKVVITNKIAWILAILRSLVSPLILIFIIYLFNFISSVNLNNEIIASMVICFSSPLSAVINAYCINYNKEPLIASDSSFLSTLISIVTIPSLIIFVNLIF